MFEENLVTDPVMIAIIQAMENKILCLPEGHVIKELFRRKISEIKTQNLDYIEFGFMRPLCDLIAVEDDVD